MKNGGGGLVNCEFLLLGEVVFKGGSVATDIECGFDKCETSVCEDGGVVARSEVFKGEVDE